MAKWYADVTLWQGIERIILAFSGPFIAWLGYLLFRHGFSYALPKFPGGLEVGAVIYSGLGPGMFFMAMGCLVLFYSIRRSTSPNVESTVPSSTDSNANLLEKKPSMGQEPLIANPPGQNDSTMEIADANYFKKQFANEHSDKMTNERSDKT